MLDFLHRAFLLSGDENHDQGTDIISFYNIESKTCPCGASNFSKVNLGV